MRVNLAKVVPWLVVGFVAVVWVAGQSGSSSADEGYSSSAYSSYGDTSRADAYLDRVAVELAQPGLYVDQSVTEVRPEDAARLDELAAQTPGPVRIAVVPADALREDDPTGDSAYYYSNPIPYDEDELVAQLYDRVGVDGTYAILVSADSSEDGRSFTAYQYSEERPYYDVEGALDAAVDCCAPRYTSMLETFIDEVGTEKTDPWPIVGWVAGIGGAALALLLGARAWLTRSRKRRDDAQVADALRPGLNEEVIDLEHQVGALPPPTAGTTAVSTPMFGSEQTTTVEQRTRTVLDLVEAARHRLDATDGSERMDTPEEVEEVVKRLADARYELVAIAAMRAGQPVPERTAPCFFDPRHGPSVDQRNYTPDYGSEREVPVCAACRDLLDAKQVPAVYEIKVGNGPLKPYWDWDRYSRPYVNGYWQRYSFADDRVQRTRYGAAPVVARRGGGSGGGMQFVWESDRSSGGGGGSFWSSGGGSSRRSSSRGRSSSRRSFGGGSSRRSSRRSGGSRKF